MFSSLFIISISHNQISKSSSYFKNDGSYYSKLKTPQLGAQETLTTVWFENPTFVDPIEPTWYSKIQDDISDVQATPNSGQFNFKVIGETHEKQILLDDAIWEAFNKTENAYLPQVSGTPTFGVDSTGAWCSRFVYTIRSVRYINREK